MLDLPLAKLLYHKPHHPRQQVIYVPRISDIQLVFFFQLIWTRYLSNREELPRIISGKKSPNLLKPRWCCFPKSNTVDGRNPTPVDRLFIPLFTRFYTSQLVVWDFFHQQYVVDSILVSGALLSLFEPFFALSCRPRSMALKRTSSASLGCCLRHRATVDPARCIFFFLQSCLVEWFGGSHPYFWKHPFLDEEIVFTGLFVGFVFFQVQTEKSEHQISASKDQQYVGDM